jgi:hypothetical protein
MGVLESRLAGAAALLADLEADRWPAGSTVVMIHSGGVPAIFAYHSELLAHLAGRRSRPVAPAEGR